MRKEDDIHLYKLKITFLKVIILYFYSNLLSLIELFVVLPMIQFYPIIVYLTSV